MDDWLSVHSQAYSKVYLLFGIIFTVNLVALIILSISYCKSNYSLDLLEENDPDIDLTGLKSFSFEAYSNMDYYPGMSNLGTTGKIYLDCFTGECEYREKYSCYKSRCSGTGKKKKCYQYKTTCTRYFDEKEYKCSSDCRKYKSSSCDSSYCTKYSSNLFYSSSCSRDTDTESIESIYQSCNADNLILFWNNLYYKRKNRTDYKRFSYLNNAVTANESCPTGTKVCGILDNLGNKFCYPESEDCPLNYITLDNSSSSYTYGNATVGNKVIYYTNEAGKNGKIVGGLFVDSDLLKKYNDEDCQILDESTVLDLLNGHYNKLYRNSLSYDPYSYPKEVQTAKSYLKWCVPGVGKEKNISRIKELNIVFKFNSTTNLEVIKPIKNMFTASYFVVLPGIIGMFFLLIVLLFSFFEQNSIYYDMGGFLRCKSTVNLIFLICIGVSCLLIIVSCILMIVNSGNISDATKLDLNIGIFKSLKSLNFAGLGICICLVIFISLFVLYLFMTSDTHIESPKPDVNNAIMKNINSNKDVNYNSSNDFNNSINTGYNSTSDFNNSDNSGNSINDNVGYNSNSDFNNNNPGGYNSANIEGYASGGNIYNPSINPV